MKKKVTSICLIGLMAFSNAVSVFAGGSLETFDITANAPSPIPGHILAKVIPRKWDARSIPVKYSMNTTLDPIPNPLGAPVLTVAQAQAAMQQSFDQWNNIPTSFINMQITGTTNNPGLAGFDMVNELTFRTAAGFGAIASSPSITLISDVTLANGDLIDNDADPDVSSAITVATDVDNDGDIEFPAGFYKAGTILDNDVQFNTKISNGLRFTTGAANADNVSRSVDLNAVATHEFGHSHGLGHSMDNQLGAADGTGATMFPFVDTSDPADELGQASLAQDDIAWSSYFYPEGTAPTGPPALQPGDKAINKEFGLIKGVARHGGLNQPLAGGSVFASDLVTGDVITSAYTGTTNLSFNPMNGGLFFVPDVATAIPNGNYEIPVRRGYYTVGIEAVDGSPTSVGNINFTTQIGGFFGQQNFVEQFWNNSSTSPILLQNTNPDMGLGDGTPVFVRAGETKTGINITTKNVIQISNFGARTAIGFINTAPGFLYAVQIPASQVLAASGASALPIQGVLFDTTVVDASVAPIFAQAMLTTGVVNPDNSVTIDLANPLQSANGFLGQDVDFAPFYFNNPQSLGLYVRNRIDNGSIENLFIVLQSPTSAPFPGVSGQPPLVGINTTGTIFGLSYSSDNGGATWTRRTAQNFRFSLVMSQ